MGDFYYFYTRNLLLRLLLSTNHCNYIRKNYKNCDYSNVKATGRVATADSFAGKIVNNMPAKSDLSVTSSAVLSIANQIPANTM